MKSAFTTPVALLSATMVLGSLGFAGTVDLGNIDSSNLHNAVASEVNFKGKAALKAEISDDARERLEEIRRERQESGARGPGGALDHLIIVGKDFQNGTIELEVAGQPGPGAAGGARGFVGVAFRVQPDRKTYDCFYLRPTNGRAEDQERRNHSLQYMSHPDYPWYRLRSENPSKYESYADLQPATWTKVKIVVDGEKARLYIDGNSQPSLIVNDVKSGPDAKGAVALWFEGSTIAHYANLKITK